MSTTPEQSADELPPPAFYAHELLNNGGGVWLACNDLSVMKQCQGDKDVGDEIVALYTADQLRAAIASSRAKDEALLMMADQTIGAFPGWDAATPKRAEWSQRARDALAALRARLQGDKTC